MLQDFPMIFIIYYKVPIITLTKVVEGSKVFKAITNRVLRRLAKFHNIVKKGKLKIAFKEVYCIKQSENKSD